MPVFPLRAGHPAAARALPLNVFEPRYLAMLDDVMSTSRVLGIVQPASGDGDESPAGKSVELRRVGCVGRVTAYQELDDGRLAIALTGIARCTLAGEVASRQALSHLSRSASSASAAISSPAAARTTSTARAFSPRSRPTWRRASSAPTGRRSPSPPTKSLVNSLAIASPYGPEEKQALLEAPTLKARAEALIALAEMELAAGAGGSGSTLQ